jgi:hypothetical protein
MNIMVTCTGRNAGGHPRRGETPMTHQHSGHRDAQDSRRSRTGIRGAARRWTSRADARGTSSLQVAARAAPLVSVKAWQTQSDPPNHEG